jgi:hypothetical protein
MVKETTENLKRVRRDSEREDGRPEVSLVIWLKRRWKTRRESGEMVKEKTENLK